MRLKISLTLVAALTSAAVLAGCSDNDPEASDGGTEPTQTASPPSGSAGGGLPHSGAPSVQNPIADTSRWEADPCAVISAEQIKSLGLEPTGSKHKDEPTGPGCFWKFNADSPSAFTGGLGTTGGREGISNLYKHKQQGSAAVFEELPAIEGHPAAVAMSKDDRSEGVCAVGVGLRDDLLYTLVMTADPSTPQGKEPCEWAAKVAGLAVQTMKGAS